MQMNELEAKVLKTLEAGRTLGADKVCELSKLDFNTVMSILSKLGEEKLINLEKTEKIFSILTPEGATYAVHGLPERRLVQHLEKSPIEFNSIPSVTGLSPTEAQLAIQWARKNGWISIMKDVGRTIVSIANKADETGEEKLLQKLKHARIDYENKPEFQNLKSRNLISIETIRDYAASITAEGKKALAKPVSERISQLTPQMLKEGKWKDVQFREYNIKVILQEAPLFYGKKHFYLEFVRDLKEQLVSLGFREAEGPFTELEFWNMDALFMPQDHPARDIHDVFQLDLPEGNLPDKAIVDGVKTAHEKGIDGSKGWGSVWNPERAKRIVLRSQTTTVSARTLAGGVSPPLKMFCIGKVFRPDDIDWKHFLEFNQCEGIVVDENMSFRELLGYLKTFAIDIFGAKPEDVQFAPSYFPFTEPSVEMMVKINGKWTEVGGAGIFRPEMAQPLGCKLPVLAWGLGLDRLAMIRLGLKDIRDLHTQNIEFLKNK